MIASRKAQVEENLIKAILFVLITIFVLVFVIKILTQLNYTPGWSKSLTAVEKAIQNLDETDLELTRTANVQLRSGYIIKGFNQDSGMCPENKENPNCVCVCKDASCTNINDDANYCRSIQYAFADDFLIDEAKAPTTFLIGLEKTDDIFQIKLIGLSE